MRNVKSSFDNPDFPEFPELVNCWVFPSNWWGNFYSTFLCFCMKARKKGSWKKTFVYFEVVLYALERMFALEMHWSKVDALDSSKRRHIFLPNLHFWFKQFLSRFSLANFNVFFFCWVMQGVPTSFSENMKSHKIIFFAQNIRQIERRSALRS